MTDFDLRTPKYRASDGTTWPPENPIERALVDIIDASPRSDWLTSGQQVLESRRIVEGLRKRGFEIVRPHPRRPA